MLNPKYKEKYETIIDLDSGVAGSAVDRVRASKHARPCAYERSGAADSGAAGESHGARDSG